jgi:hypothetical protein
LPPFYGGWVTFQFLGLQGKTGKKYPSQKNSPFKVHRSQNLVKTMPI